MMTTMAAMLGGVPLMLGTGTGSEIRQPLGYAMVGGLIVSQALTLFTTPVVYLYLDKLSNVFSGWGRSDNDDQDSTPARTARSRKPPNSADTVEFGRLKAAEAVATRAVMPAKAGI